MQSSEIRQKFLAFFEKHGHAVVPSSSLIPDDPSVLLTTAGMQQFKPYYTGDADPLTSIHPTLGKPLGSKNAVSIQKSFRTSDIDEVGDERHLTFFEMMGNFSFGGYFKEEAIKLAHQFLTKEMGLEISYVTIFQGKEDIGVPKDEESRKIWQSLDVADIREEGMEDVFWGPTGSAGPCGPTTEIYCKNGAGQDIEVWNIVFNEFFFNGSREELLSGASEKKLEPLKTPGVDTGMGLERLVMCIQKTPTIFETDLFLPLINIIESDNTEVKRVISDHIRGAVHLIADGVEPSNKDRGYILRRILRRAIFHVTRTAGEGPKTLSQNEQTPLSWDQRTDKILKDLMTGVINLFPDLQSKKDLIWETIKREEGRFLDVLKSASALEKIIEKYVGSNNNIISGAEAFELFSTFGIPIDYIRDRVKRVRMDVDVAGFEREVEKHREISRAGSQAKFGGHGLYMKTGEVTIRDESEVEKVTRLHTATHLLHAALRAVLGPEVRQDGSDITVERTRFDFRFSRKVTPDELKKVEAWVHDAISRDLKVEYKEMAYEEALAEGALGFFKEKYPPRVKVYTMFDSGSGVVYSKEFCGGPHVAHTGEVGRFRITKEESSSAGVRRIRGIIDN